jgi:hypothetical protein
VNRYDPGGMDDCSPGVLACTTVTEFLPPNLYFGPGAPAGGWGTAAYFNGAIASAVAGAPALALTAAASVLKSYSETVSCNETPSQLISSMESNFGSFANYSGTFGPLGLPVATASVQFTGTVALGSTISISDVNLITLPIPSIIPIVVAQVQNVAVQVTAVNVTNFTFTTLPGHVLYPAAISFSATAGANGQLTFGINVAGNFSSTTSGALYYAGGSSLENNIWNNVLANVGKACSQ